MYARMRVCVRLNSINTYTHTHTPIIIPYDCHRSTENIRRVLFVWGRRRRPCTRISINRAGVVQLRERDVNNVFLLQQQLLITRISDNDDVKKCIK